MITKPKIKTKTIPFDYGRSVPDKKGAGGVVLFYDEANGCYYETTLADVSAVFIGELRKAEAEIEERFAELEKKQNEFIRSSAEVNRRLIELVEANTK